MWPYSIACSSTAARCLSVALIDDAASGRSARPFASSSGSPAAIAFRRVSASVTFARR
jgi:hypothetical protein